MRRNLDRRIEAVTPIEDYELKSKIYKLLQTYIKDNYFSWIMKDDGSYSKYELDSSHNRSQIDLIENKINIDFTTFIKYLIFNFFIFIKSSHINRFQEISLKKNFLSLKFQRKSSFYFNFSASFLKNPLFRRPG